MRNHKVGENHKRGRELQPLKLSYHTDIQGLQPSGYSVPRETLMFIEGFESMITNYLNDVSLDVFNDGTLFHDKIDSVIDRALANLDAQHEKVLKEGKDRENIIKSEIFNLRKKYEFSKDKLSDKTKAKIIEEETRNERSNKHQRNVT